MVDVFPVINEHDVSKYKVVASDGFVRLKKTDGDDMGPATIDFEIIGIEKIIELLKNKGLL